mmetsp:Transcript_13301/g.41375  ORF Transcript_13301/g.41375 Transcript_13301/m.41375 type:complete len:302 (-) Transcript_13301:232-1137(-)
MRFRRCGWLSGSPGEQYSFLSARGSKPASFTGHRCRSSVQLNQPLRSSGGGAGGAVVKPCTPYLASCFVPKCGCIGGIVSFFSRGRMRSNRSSCPTPTPCSPGIGFGSAASTPSSWWSTRLPVRCSAASSVFSITPSSSPRCARFVDSGVSPGPPRIRKKPCSGPSAKFLSNAEGVDAILLISRSRAMSLPRCTKGSSFSGLVSRVCPNGRALGGGKLPYSTNRYAFALCAPSPNMRLPRCAASESPILRSKAERCSSSFRASSSMASSRHSPVWNRLASMSRGCICFPRGGAIAPGECPK